MHRSTNTRNGEGIQGLQLGIAELYRASAERHMRYVPRSTVISMMPARETVGTLASAPMSKETFSVAGVAGNQPGPRLQERLQT